MIKVHMMASMKELEVHERLCGDRASQHDLAITVDTPLRQDHY